jgi:hypothetical protein
LFEPQRETTMIGRRRFIAGAATTMAAPFILTQINAQTPRIRRDVQSLAPTDPWFANTAKRCRRCMLFRRQIQATGAVGAIKR